MVSIWSWKGVSGISFLEYMWVVTGGVANGFDILEYKWLDEGSVSSMSRFTDYILIYYAAFFFGTTTN